HIAALDRGADRAPAIAVKAEPGADADRFHGQTVARVWQKANAWYAAQASASFRKPPTGPAKGRPDDRLRGCPESMTTARAIRVGWWLWIPGSTFHVAPE